MGNIHRRLDKNPLDEGEKAAAVRSARALLENLRTSPIEPRSDEATAAHAEKFYNSVHRTYLFEQLGVLVEEVRGVLMSKLSRDWGWIRSNEFEAYLAVEAYLSVFKSEYMDAIKEAEYPYLTLQYADTLLIGLRASHPHYTNDPQPLATWSIPVEPIRLDCWLCAYRVADFDMCTKHMRRTSFKDSVNYKFARANLARPTLGFL